MNNSPVSLTQHYSSLPARPEKRPVGFGNAAPVARQAEKAAATEISGLAFAQKMAKTVQRIKFDMQIGNLSSVDVASRAGSILGWYAPQGLLAFVDKRHPFEMNGRNAITWLATLYITMLAKNPRYSINTFLDQFMRQKATLAQDLTRKQGLYEHAIQNAVQTTGKLADELRLDHPLKALVPEQNLQASLNQAEKTFQSISQAIKNQQNDGSKEAKAAKKELKKKTRALGKQLKQAKKQAKQLGKVSGKLAYLAKMEAQGTPVKEGFWRKQVLNRLRPDQDYFEHLSKAGISWTEQDRAGAKWASLKLNQQNALIHHYKALGQKLNEPGLTESAKKALLSDRRFMRRFLTQMMGFKVLQTAFMASVTVAVVGNLIPKSVFKVFAPLDEKFGFNNKKPDKKAPSKAAPSPQPPQPPSPFQNTATPPATLPATRPPATASPLSSAPGIPIPPQHQPMALASGGRQP